LDDVVNGKPPHTVTSLPCCTNQVLEIVSAFPALALALDASGRKAVDVASRPMKGIVQSVLLWHGRYRITDLRPEHASATCFVYKAVDEVYILRPAPVRNSNPHLTRAFRPSAANDRPGDGGAGQSGHKTHATARPVFT
jgi:hypothetical protein